MLMGSIELRHAPFALWFAGIRTGPVLPAVLMGVTMFFIQKMSPTTVTDALQSEDRGPLCPVIFTIVLPVVPVRSGAVLYRQQHGHHHSAAADLPVVWRSVAAAARRKNPDSV